MNWCMLGQFREIQKTWIWNNADYYKWWSDMVFMANYNDSAETLQVGEFVATRTMLCQRWNTTPQIVKTFITKLLRDNMISVRFVDRKSVYKINNFYNPKVTRNQPESNPKSTHLTDCNTDCYKGEQPESNPKVTRNQPESNPNNISKSISNNNNNNIIYTPLPPNRGLSAEPTAGGEQNTQENNLNLSGVETEPQKRKKVAQKKEIVFNVNWDKFMDFFNATMQGSNIRGITVMTNKRKAQVKSRYREMEKQFPGRGKEKIIEVLKTAANDDFCNGRSDCGWKATFDSIFTAKVFLTLAEGGYNRGQKTRQSGGGSKKTTAFDALNEIYGGGYGYEYGNSAETTIGNQSSAEYTTAEIIS